VIAEPKAPRDYIELPSMPSHWKVLDVGPGAYPLRRADVYLDHDPEKLAPMKAEGKETILADLADGLGLIPDKAFDYVWCSHVLEHIDNPEKCAATLSRIGKAGIVIVPSAIKESLFNFEEAEHKWLILPHPNGGLPIFIRHNKEYIKRIKDVDVQKIMCRLFRSGTSADLPDDQYLRNWFTLREPDLDVVIDWEVELKVQVIG